MNVATPQEQFASKARISKLPWKQRPAGRSRAVNLCIKKQMTDWVASSCPWPCYAERETYVSLSRQAYFDLATIRDITQTVAHFYGVEEGEVYSRRRTAKIVLPRQIAFYLSKDLTRKSYPELGMDFGRDHTTILHAVQKIEKMMAESPAFAEQVRLLRAKLEGGN